jgi:hypothetical protein
MWVGGWVHMVVFSLVAVPVWLFGFSPKLF